MSLRWKIYYAGGESYSDADGSPYDAPRLNVMCVVGADFQVGRYMVSDKDAYWWEHGRWFGGDRRGEWDHLLHARQPLVLYGRAVPDEVYNAAISAALSDPAFPPKTAIGRGETTGD
jgi:hypothetical protein